eukprot:gene14829-31494_t
MEEIWELQRKLAEVQKVDSAYKLSERNCVEIISKLIAKGLLEVIYTLNAREYLTPAQLKSEIHDEILTSGGRVALTDIQTIVNVDINHIDRISREIINEDPEIFLISGELITSWYLDNLADAVDEIIQEKGFITIGNLAIRFNLPTDITSDMVKQRLGIKIKAVLK